MATQARGARKSVILKEATAVNVEAYASGTITPGMLVERTSATKDTVIAHDDDAPATKPMAMFACEDELQGNGIDVDFSDGDLIPQIRIMRPGDQVLAILDNGENVTKGGYLESAGNGKLQAYTSGVPTAIALESVDMSDSSGADPTGRIAVEIL